MVFSKDAYSPQADAKPRAQGKTRGENLNQRLYLLIFFRAFLKETVALVVAGRKNAQLFRLA